MFDFGLGSSELLLVAIVALIVIGPKDLPRLLRTMGQYMRKIQGMAREFQNHLNEAAKETGVDDVKKDIKGMTNFTVTSDLDKQGNEIKKAIESSATKAAPASPSNGAKTADTKAAETKAADSKTTASKTADTKAPEAKAAETRAGAAAAKTESAKPSAASSKPAPAAKAAPTKTSKAAPKPKAAAKPKPAAKAKSRPVPKTDRPRVTAKS